ncbi:Separin [Nymphon striatum]|nr:Separin [Nymphon striatum]
MNPNDLLKRLRDNGANEYENVLKYFELLGENATSLSGSESPESFATRCLRYLCSDLKSVKEISHNNVSKLLLLVTKCCDCYHLFLTNTKLDKQETVVERALYHLIYDLIRLGEHNKSVEVGNHLHRFLQIQIQQSKLNKELSSVLNGTYLSFWNSALNVKEPEYAANEIPALALQLRGQAISFLLLDKSPDSENIQRLSTKIYPAMQAYAFSVSQIEKPISPHLQLNEFFMHLLPSFYEWISDIMCNSKTDNGNVLSLFVEVQQNLFKYLKRLDCLDKVWTDTVKVWLNKKYFDSFDHNCDEIFDFVDSHETWDCFEFIHLCRTQLMEHQLSRPFSYSDLIRLSCLNCAFLYLRFSGSTLVLLAKESGDRGESPITFLLGYCIEINNINSWFHHSESNQTFFGPFLADACLLILRFYKLVIDCDDGLKIGELLPFWETFYKLIGDLHIQDIKILEQLEKEFGKIANAYAQDKSYFMAAYLYSCTCEFFLRKLEFSASDVIFVISRNKIDTNVLAQYLQVLATCHKKDGNIYAALQTLYICMCINKNSVVDCFGKWVKFKTALDKNEHSLQKLTIHEMHNEIHKENGCLDSLKRIVATVPKKYFINVDLLLLLDAELDIAKKKDYEHHSVVEHILLLADKFSLMRAKALLHRFQLEISDSVISSSNYSEAYDEALEILTAVEKKNHKMSLVRYYFGLAYFWQYVMKFNHITAVIEEEIKVNDIKPLDQVVENQSPTQQDGLVDENDTCDVIPAYAGISVEAEIELTKTSLDLALKSWSEFEQILDLNCLSIFEKESLIFMLKTMSEIYNCYKRVAEEIKCLSLAGIICSKVNFIKDWIFFNSLLIRRLCSCQQYTKAGALYESTKDLAENRFDLESLEHSTSAKLVHFTYILAEADYMFQTTSKSVSSYVKNLQDHPVMLMKSRSGFLAQSEAYLFLSNVFLAQPRCIQDKLSTDKNTNTVPLFLKLRAVECAIWVIKTINTEGYDNYEDELYCRCKALNHGTDACLSLGKLFLNIGAIREARCFLKEGLKISQAIPLAIRTVEGLAAMIETDLLCGNLADCRVKLAGIFYILTKSVDNSTVEKLGCDNSSDSDNEEFLVTRPGRQTNTPFILRDRTESDIMASPNLRKNTSKNIVLPKFVHHAKNCHCVHCAYLHLQIQLITYVSLSGDALQLELDFDQAFQMYLLTEKLSFQFSCCPHKDFVKFCSLPLYKIEEDDKDSNSMITICRCQTGAKVADLMFRLKNSGESISYARRTLDIFSKLPNCVKCAFPMLHTQLRYLLCVSSLQLWAKLKSTSVSKLFADKWMCLLPSYLEPLSKISNQNDVCKTPLGDNIAKATKISKKVSSELKQCRAPVKKTSRLKKVTQDLNSGMMNLTINEDSCEETVDATDATEKRELSNSVVAKEISPISKFKEPRSSHIKTVRKETVEKVERKKILTEPKSTKNSKRNIMISSKHKTIPDFVIEPVSSKKSHKVVQTKRTTKHSKNCAEIHESSENKNSSSLNEDIPSVKSKIISKKLLNKVDPIKNIEETVVTRLRKQSTRFEDEVSVTNKRTTRSKLKSSNGTSPMDRPKKKVRQAEIETLRSADGSSDEEVKIYIDDLAIIPEKYENNIEKMMLYPLEDIQNILLSAKKDLEGFPPSILYKDICVLLALVSGNKTEDKTKSPSSYLCEGTAIVLRHLGICTILRKIGKNIQKNSSLIKSDLNMSDSRNSEHTYEDIFQIQNEQLDVLNFNNSSDISDLISKIPEEWTVVQVNSLHPLEKLNDSNVCPSELFITRYRKNECYTVRTKLQSSEFFVENNDQYVDNIYVAFTRILSVTKLTLNNVTKSADWWKTRRQHDSDMKVAITEFEERWLKHWRGMFLGKPAHAEDLDRLNQAVEKCKSAFEKLNVFVESAPLNVCNISLFFFFVVIIRLSALKYHIHFPLKAVIDGLHMLPEDQIVDAVCSLTQLQPTHPNFRKLRNCIEHYSKIVNSDLFEREHVILILGKDIQHVPWEGTKVLSKSPVCRMPSLHLLISHLTLLETEPNKVSGKRIDTDNAFYVLNPSGDLMYTENYFTEPFQQMKWEGVVHQPPTPENFEFGLTEKDLFIYCGHGTGGTYLAGESIRRLNCKAAVFLVGCSSGFLKCLGPKLEPVGAIHHYLLSGCPSILGMLWDITDKDIDGFLDDLLRQWLPKWKNKENDNDLEINYITKHIASARNVCKMKYLTGCSCIVYGLPIYQSS